MDTSRLFFALWPNKATRETVIELRKEFHDQYGGRAVPAEALHITLAFLGETPNARFAELSAIGRSVMTPSFQLTLSRAGCWSGGIFWLAPIEPPLALIALVMSLHGALKAEKVLFDNKRFVPHMTLLRRAGSRGTEMMVAPIELSVQDFVLVQALRTEKGARYEVIERFPLAAG